MRQHRREPLWGIRDQTQRQIEFSIGSPYRIKRQFLAAQRVKIERNAPRFALGPATFQIIETPGHTQGSISLFVPEENKLIAGDTLFRDSVGRTDLPGGDGQQILRSIHDKLLTLPDDAVVIPGHGAQTTIGRERERNPFLRGL